jgi:hypothetical protein
LTVYGDSMPLGLKSPRLLALSADEGSEPGSLEAPSNMAAMALTALPVDLTGLDRGTVLMVGRAGSG